MLHKAWNSKEEMPYCFPRTFIKFEGHTGQNITDFDPNWAFPDYRPVAAFKSLRFALFHFGKYHGKLTRIYVLRVCIGYLVVPVNHSKLDFVNLTQMWRKILICNEFTFNVLQYLFAMFRFHPTSTISTQDPLLCRAISTQHPYPFHPSFRRKIGLVFLTFWIMPRLHISHIAVNLHL